MPENENLDAAMDAESQGSNNENNSPENEENTLPIPQ